MPDQVEHIRFGYTPMRTLGRMKFPGFQCFTVERPWQNNERGESCIPEGTYPLKFGTYHAGGYDAYKVLDVPKRDLIKIHLGNSIDEVIGDIAPGKALDYIHGKRAAGRSRVAFEGIMHSMNGQQESSIFISNYQPMDTFSQEESWEESCTDEAA